MTEETMSSLEADKIPGVKELTEALSPWPISNERVWFIVKKHFDHTTKLEAQVRDLLFRVDDLLDSNNVEMERRRRAEGLVSQYKRALERHVEGSECQGCRDKQRVINRMEESADGVYY